jgi:plastocyanin
MVAGFFGSTITASATSTTYTIGVDNATPNGHDFEYVDFFPRGLPLSDSGASPTLIRDGATLDFAWNSGSPDGFHTATLLKKGTAPGPTTWGSDHPVAVPDTDDGTGRLQLNPAILAPGPDPSCGHDANHPCNYGGGTELNSGAQPTGPGGHYFVQMALDTSRATTIHFVCLIHPGMQGAVTVLPADSEALPLTTAQVSAAAAAQYNADNTEAFSAESAANSAAVKTNADGSRTTTMTAGTASQHVEVVEMLPSQVRVRQGDHVKWVTKTRSDIHTVTFPNGAGSNSVDPIPFVCEGTGAVDTAGNPAAGPPAFGCTSPDKVENHLIPGPLGPRAITSTSTVASSGILANPPAPFPNNFTFTFPKPGSFAYMCRIHDHMVGTIVVTAVRQLAQTGRGDTSGSSSVPFGALFGVVALLLGLGILATRRLGSIRR